MQVFMSGLRAKQQNQMQVQNIQFGHLSAVAVLDGILLRLFLELQIVVEEGKDRRLMTLIVRDSLCKPSGFRAPGIYLSRLSLPAVTCHFQAFSAQLTLKEAGCKKCSMRGFAREARCVASLSMLSSMT